MRLSISPDDEIGYAEYCKIRDKPYKVLHNTIPQPHAIACETGRIGGWVERYVTVDGTPDGSPLILIWQPQTERVYGCVEIKFDEPSPLAQLIAAQNQATHAHCHCGGALLNGACTVCGSGRRGWVTPLAVPITFTAPAGPVDNPFCGSGETVWSCDIPDKVVLRRGGVLVDKKP